MQSSLPPRPRDAGSESSGATIIADRVFDGDRMRHDILIRIVGGVIEAVEPREGRERSAISAFRLGPGVTLAPGFIDVQVNGGGGVLLNDDPSLATIRKIAAAHLRFGTTGLLPTLITDSRDRLERLAAIANEAMAIPGVLGFHLEGPHLNVSRKGIHPPQHIRALTDQDMALLSFFGTVGRSVVTLAPECVPDGAIAALVSAGLRVSLGHSDATAEQAEAATQSGATGVTHLYNAMSQMAGREPGLVGATLADERLFAGLICDGLHVHPVSLRAAHRAKGAERLMLVSDAMASIGADQGDFLLQGRAIRLVDGKLIDAQGTLAGAHLDMIGAVRIAVEQVGIPLDDALAMASRTPSAFLGFGGERGRIAPGYRADLVAFDESFTIVGTWIDGDHRSQ